MATYTAYSGIVNSYNNTYSNLYTLGIEVVTGTPSGGKIPLTISSYIYCRWPTSSQPYNSFNQDFNIKVNGSEIYGYENLGTEQSGYDRGSELQPDNANDWSSTSVSVGGTTFQQRALIRKQETTYTYGYNSVPTITVSSYYRVLGSANYIPGSSTTASASITLPLQPAPYDAHMGGFTSNVPPTEIHTNVGYTLPSGFTLENAKVYYRRLDPTTLDPVTDTMVIDVTSNPNDVRITGLVPDSWYEVNCSVTSGGITIYPNNYIDDGQDAYSLEESVWSVMATSTPIPNISYSYEVVEDDIGSGPWKIIVDVSGTTVSPTKNLRYDISCSHGTKQAISNTKAVFYNIPEETTITVYLTATALSDSGVPDESSDYENVSITTPTAQAKAYTRQGNSWSLGKIYFKTSGAWVKAKKIYVKVGGVWKEGD